MKTLFDLRVGQWEHFQSCSCVAGKPEGGRDGRPCLSRPVGHSDYPSLGGRSDQCHQLQKRISEFLVTLRLCFTSSTTIPWRTLPFSFALTDFFCFELKRLLFSFCSLVPFPLFLEFGSSSRNSKLRALFLGKEFGLQDMYQYTDCKKVPTPPLQQPPFLPSASATETR